ncbi:hydrogenase expression/formation protein HupK [Palleronia sp. KMU-117]|uniref:hydrogenase expression/formation protein HupK n=1 Tax=Palleronia sp. KMU-117 TaxID=3434108 RepID=UPI003D745D89
MFDAAASATAPATAPAAPSALVAQRAPGVPVDRLVVGRDVDEVAALLPRLFNLCRAAQGAAVEAALGRPVATAGIAQEILRDHLVKFHVTWPAFFGLPPAALPADWATGGEALRRAVFGAPGRAPVTAAEVFDFLASEDGVAPVLRRIDGCFAPGEAAAPGIAPVTPETMWDVGPVDNSVAARTADHPAMRAIEAARGRGPLWRAAARLFDIERVIAGGVAAIVAPRRGEAVVPAARGAYAVRIALDGRAVTAFARVTPTDHLLTPGGVLDRALSTLPALKAGLGPLLLDILDPCSPVRLREGTDA